LAILHDFNFVFRQAAEFIDKRVHLLVGGGDGVLKGGYFRMRRKRAQPGPQSQRSVCQSLAEFDRNGKRPEMR
jgi:hypothetical protein